MQVLNLDFHSAQLAGSILQNGQLLLPPARAPRVYPCSIHAGWSCLDDHASSIRYLGLDGQGYHRGQIALPLRPGGEQSNDVCKSSHPEPVQGMLSTRNLDWLLRKGEK